MLRTNNLSDLAVRRSISIEQNPDNPKLKIFNSELKIDEGDRLNEDPLCILEFPEIISSSFHGKWQPHP